MPIREEESMNDTDALVESVSRAHLVNILNYVNFNEKSVALNLRRLSGGSRISLRAIPEPCSGENVRLTWSENPPSDIDEAYEYTDFFIDKGSKVLIVDGKLADISRAGITILLPECCHATSRRRKQRFDSEQVEATIAQNGSEAKGVLKDFGAGFIKLRITAREAAFLLLGINKPPLRVALRRGETTVYDGKAVIERRMARGDEVDLVLALIPSVPDESKERTEVELDPPLIAVYRHPLSDRIIHLEVLKASYSAFLVREDPKHEALLAGLVLPEVKIDFGTGDSARCSARVEAGEANTWFLSILDMPVPEQRKLFSFIEKETGMGSGASTVLDPNDLIEFFFEAGFIYPEKYVGVVHSRDRLKEILSRLYIDTPSISRHFIEYDRRLIEGHICMVRFYERAWVVNHHAAIGSRGAGSAVLLQIFRYIHGYSHLPSTGMDYAMTYYRPENRFPYRVLGGFARSLKAPGLCSVDPFAYLHVLFDGCDRRGHGEEEWQLEPTSQEDLVRLETFYEGASGGLTLKAFGLDSECHARETIDLDGEFRKVGLRRRKSFFSLRHRGKVKAVMMSTDSDAGLNMSNLMKCIHIFIIDGEDLPVDLLISQLNRLSSLYEEREIPVLFFPPSYMSDQGAAYEKIYHLLVLRTSIVRQFIEFVERLTDRAMRRRYGGRFSEREGKTGEQR